MTRGLRTGVQVALLLLVAALFLPFVGVPFVYDDKVEILQNRVLRTPLEFSALWTYNPFRVLLLTTFAWDIWAWGLGNVWPYRVENIVIHGANVLLLLGINVALAPRLLPGAPAARQGLLAVGGALLFAVHPLAIESVTYISGRSSSLATFFVLATIRLWLAFLDGLTRDAEAARWLGAELRRANWTLGVTLGAGLVVGLPLAVAVALGALAPGRAAISGVAVWLAVLAVLGAALAERWRGTGAPAPPLPRRRAVRRTALLAVGAFLTFVAGCLTKEIAATLPVVLLLIEWIAFQGADLRATARALRGRLFPFFAVPAFLVVLRVTAYGYLASPTFIRPPLHHALTQVEVLAQYLRLWIVPFPQSIYHDHPVVTPPGTAGTLLAAVVLCALLGGALALRRRAPAFALGVLIAGVTVAPTSSVFALKETMVEHRTYLPSIGLCLATAWLFAGPLWDLAARLGRRRPLLHAAAPLLLCCVALAVEHRAYQERWRHEELLWRSALSVNGRSADAWRALSDVYAAEARWSEAESALLAALRVRPHDPVLLSKLGRALGAAGRLPEAEKLLRRAVSFDPCATAALNSLAHLLATRGDVPAAIDLYFTSLRCAPKENYFAQRGLGDIYYSEVQDREKAGQHYTQALEALDPSSPDAPLLKRRLQSLTW